MVLSEIEKSQITKKRKEINREQCEDFKRVKVRLAAKHDEDKIKALLKLPGANAWGTNYINGGAHLKRFHPFVEPNKKLTYIDEKRF